MTRELLLKKICPNACINDCRFIGCSQCNKKLNEWLDKYDKHVIEQYKADTNLKDTIIESRLQAIKDIASASCADEKDADNIAGFCDEIYSAIPKLDKIIEELEQKKTKLLSYARDYEKIGNFEQAEIYSQIASEYTTAIEIVKQGEIK